MAEQLAGQVANSKTDTVLEELSKLHPRGYDLSLGRVTRLLQAVGSPQLKIPAPFHVAGTNGKGSTIANLRAILEAAGLRIHTHTSPHLVRFHERYRIADDSAPGTSRLVDDELLAATLTRLAHENQGQEITIFELLAAATFMLFSSNPADHCIIEVGLGGRFDATNVMPAPHATIITPISLDHQGHLGDTLAKIAFEKAGIIKQNVPVVIGPQEDEALEVLLQVAQKNNAPTKIARQDFDWYEERGQLIYQDEFGLLELPLPALHGEHQLENSATAIAATRLHDHGFELPIYENAMASISWPGRMQKLVDGEIPRQLKAKGINAEIWVDGGHNEAAAAELAKMLETFQARDPKPLTIITAMLSTKQPEDFFRAFANLDATLHVIPITTSDLGMMPTDLAKVISKLGMKAEAHEDITSALTALDHHKDPVSGELRLLFCGSLYLAGEILKENGTPPE